VRHYVGARTTLMLYVRQLRVSGPEPVIEPAFASAACTMHTLAVAWVPPSSGKLGRSRERVASQWEPELLGKGQQQLDDADLRLMGAL